MYKVPDEMEKRIECDFTYHPPKDMVGDDVVPQIERYQLLRNEAACLALKIVKNTPPSREQSLALTKLEEVVMWANAAIARNE